MWHRRAFLKAAGSAFVAGLLPRGAEALEAAELVLASSLQRADGGYGAALMSERGRLIASIELPDRGHDISFARDGSQAVVFARQPGTFAVVFDPRGERPSQTLTAVEGRHFFGHGAFSADGRLLYATENDFEAGRGVIGLYDATDGFSRIGEFDGFGIGPHELLLSPDGTTLVVANGGIETHPDYGRSELNLETMDPSLCFIDARTGDLLGQLRLAAELHQLSIRHLAFDALGRVWFGCQFRGAASGRPQLVGRATRDGDIRLIELPEEMLGELRNYVGSVAASGDGETIAVSSPQGDLVLALNARNSMPQEMMRVADGCGLAPGGEGFFVSSGQGTLSGFAAAESGEQQFDFRFDNHLRVVPERRG